MQLSSDTDLNIMDEFYAVILLILTYWMFFFQLSSNTYILMGFMQLTFYIDVFGNEWVLFYADILHILIYIIYEWILYSYVIFLINIFACVHQRPLTSLSQPRCMMLGLLSFYLFMLLVVMVCLTLSTAVELKCGVISTLHSQQILTVVCALVACWCRLTLARTLATLKAA